MLLAIYNFLVIIKFYGSDGAICKGLEKFPSMGIAILTFWGQTAHMVTHYLLIEHLKSDFWFARSDIINAVLVSANRTVVSVGYKVLTRDTFHNVIHPLAL